MKHWWLALILFGISGFCTACEKKPKQQSVDDVVYNLVDPKAIERDIDLQNMYDCRYVFAMLFSSSGYERMRLISGSQPPTPTDETGAPIKGVVMIGFILNTDGSPVDPVVLESSDERLSKLALEHVLGLKYQPSRFKSRPVRSLGIQAYNYE